uniref:MD-2-related lipid-recognition domain-containing protein n=1 Tax=Stomoxys calcitrans TaxID=35570 RepID=A0A1I8PS12_STOCA
MLPQFPILIIALNCVIINQAADVKNFDLVSHRLLCKNLDSKVIKRLECSYAKLGPNRFTGSGIVMLNQQFGTNFNIHIRVNVGTGAKIVKFIDLKLNVCDTLHRGISLPLLRQIMINLLKNSNFPRKCPLKKNFLYNGSNVIIDDTYFPTYTPTPLNVNFSIDYFADQKKFAIFRLEGSVLPKVKK